MKIKKLSVKPSKGKSGENSPVVKDSRRLPIISLVLSVLATAVTICLTVYQISLSQIQTELNQVFSPITYEVFESENGFQYSFSGLKVQKGYPCIRFTNGRPKDVAVILYNSRNDKMIVTSCAVQTTEEIVIQDIKTEMPRDAYAADAVYAYDYFFLYFTDSSNTVYLSLIYCQIDLKQGSISECQIASKADLLLLENEQLDEYKREMLSDYKELLQKIDAIP